MTASLQFVLERATTLSSSLYDVWQAEIRDGRCEKLDIVNDSDFVSKCKPHLADLTETLNLEILEKTIRMRHGTHCFMNTIGTMIHGNCDTTWERQMSSNNNEQNQRSKTVSWDDLFQTDTDHLPYVPRLRVESSLCIFRYHALYDVFNMMVLTSVPHPAPQSRSRSGRERLIFWNTLTLFCSRRFCWCSWSGPDPRILLLAMITDWSSKRRLD